jgi:hypothetical protein
MRYALCEYDIAVYSFPLTLFMLSFFGLLQIL